jgi:hypothetical protein
MWRPVALSAFLALLFMSSRSGEEPIDHKAQDVSKTNDVSDTNGSGKSDFGPQGAEQRAGHIKIKLDLAQSSAHAKTEDASGAKIAMAKPPDAAAQSAVTAETDTIDVASVVHAGRQTIPLPAPKSDPNASDTRVVVTLGEQKTALTNGEEALRLMPPGPDFASQVQRELARLGCYRGRVDNIWGPMSRNAVAQFNRFAKANLPMTQPTRALLSSARKAPDGYCTAAANGEQPKLAALDPSVSLEAIKNRPSYLPPWMRGEPMPESDENVVEAQEEPEASPSAPSTQATTPRQAKPPNTRRARKPSRQVRQRRAARPARRSFERTMADRGAFWPGQ